MLFDNQEYEMHRKRHEELKRIKTEKVEAFNAAKLRLSPLDTEIKALNKKKEGMDAQMKSKASP